MANPTGMDACPALARSPLGFPPGAFRRSVLLGLTPNPFGVLPPVASGLGRAAPSGGAVLAPWASKRELARVRP